ncbi:hypothetical protein NG749_00770 [Aliarcobacter cryaerophilus]|uniref:hypothetical protein n=1 Tax=Aliarcobacter cryaerophilus TaxID=28198 RepID=UPI003DA24F65
MIPQCFKDYPEKKFKLIAVNDIDYTYPHRYKVIFQDIDTDDEFEEKIFCIEYSDKIDLIKLESK